MYFQQENPHDPEAEAEPEPLKSAFELPRISNPYSSLVRPKSPGNGKAAGEARRKFSELVETVMRSRLSPGNVFYNRTMVAKNMAEGCVNSTPEARMQDRATYGPHPCTYLLTLVPSLLNRG